MIPVERQLGEVAEVMTGMAGFGTGGEYRYKVVQPNSFSDTGIMGMVEQQKRNDEISEKQRLMIGDIPLLKNTALSVRQYTSRKCEHYGVVAAGRIKKLI